jgi:hypothetical protein
MLGEAADHIAGNRACSRRRQLDTRRAGDKAWSAERAARSEQQREQTNGEDSTRDHVILPAGS